MKNETIKIGFLDVKIEEVESVSDGSMYACIDWPKALIEIESNLSPQIKTQVLLHETIHGMDEVFTIGLSEKQTDRIASAFCVFIQDNPEFFKSLMEGLVNGRQGKSEVKRAGNVKGGVREAQGGA